MLYLYVMKKSHGFTVIELIVVIVFAGLATSILLYQRANIEASQRDETRKTAINAMYYNLEEVFYEENSYYPESIDSKTLRAMDPELFTDPYGNKLGEAASNYRYEASDCQDDKCQGYRLQSLLEKEADYVKTNRNN